MLYLYCGSCIDDVIAPQRPSAIAIRTRPTLIAFRQVRALGTSETRTGLFTLVGVSLCVCVCVCVCMMQLFNFRRYSGILINYFLQKSTKTFTRSTLSCLC